MTLAEARALVTDRNCVAGHAECIRLEERVDVESVTTRICISPLELARVFAFASGMTAAKLLAENDVERNAAGAQVALRPNAKGYAAVIAAWKAAGKIA